MIRRLWLALRDVPWLFVVAILLALAGTVAAVLYSLALAIALGLAAIVFSILDLRHG